MSRDQKQLGHYGLGRDESPGGGGGSRASHVKHIWSMKMIAKTATEPGLFNCNS